MVAQDLGSRESAIYLAAMRGSHAQVALKHRLNAVDLSADCRRIPPLAGLCSFADAQRVSLSVEQCVTWMKRHHYLLVRLHEILTARITSEPIYELKTAFSLHAYLCAEHVSAYRQRISELREPPLGLGGHPRPCSLKLLCDEVSKD